ncbi:MAG: transcriptional repressor [Candidatus Zixiibacteriota bacterium]
MPAGKQQRNTRQRQVILEELRKLTSHPTAADLYEVVRKRLPKISLGTVYRNLELLAQNRTIQKLDMVGSEARFDGNPDRHCHVRCNVCGRVGDLQDLPPDPLRKKIREANGWEISGYRIEFEGTCPKCRGKHQFDRRQS